MAFNVFDVLGKSAASQKLTRLQHTVILLGRALMGEVVAFQVLSEKD